MRGLWAHAAIVLAIGIPTGAHAQNAQHRADPEAGHRLAVRVCEGCHVVASRQETPSSLRGYGPSFFDIAKKPDTTRQSLQVFLAHPHALAKMPYPDLNVDQTADVSAYILSLRGKH
jgi:mono/diheme cytochrome c family protein